MTRKFRKLSLTKYLFFGLLILCVTAVVTILYFIDNNTEDLSVWVNLPPPQFSQDMLADNFEECFIQNFHDFVTNGNVKLNGTLLSIETGNNASITYDEIIPDERMKTLFEFTAIAQVLEIETIVIEPSLLLCILSPKLKLLLKKRNVTFSNSLGHIITMGVREKFASSFERVDVQSVLEIKGFLIEIIKSPNLSWMIHQKLLNTSHFISHIFLKKDRWTIHLVVFYERNNFLWHSSLLKLSSGNHQFVREDAAFDNFSEISLGFKHSVLKPLNIPSSPAHFLYEIETSRFLECNKTINDKFMQISPTGLPSIHYNDLSVTYFNQRLIISIQKLKESLDPMMMRFWIWSGTMLGWYRQCNVIPYTSDADFAAWATDIDDFEKLISGFIENKHLRIKQKMGFVEKGLEFNLNCHGMRVDLFFIYEQENGTWYAGHLPKTGSYFKYHHPNFSLCSAELLEQKVLVPCETENMIATEYGPNWMQPVPVWSYERSPKNMGPELFWEKTFEKF